MLDSYYYSSSSVKDIYIIQILNTHLERFLFSALRYKNSATTNRSWLTFLRRKMNPCFKTWSKWK